MLNPTIILLAEDSSDDVFFFRRALQKASAQSVLVVVENGQQAIDYLAGQSPFSGESPQPDLLFLDLKMPEVDGFAVLEWISSKSPKPPFRVIVLTSSDEPRDYKRALELGASDYLLKPISPEQLTQILTSLQTGQVQGTGVVPGSPAGA